MAVVICWLFNFEYIYLVVPKDNGSQSLVATEKQTSFEVRNYRDEKMKWMLFRFANRQICENLYISHYKTQKGTYAVHSTQSQVHAYICRIVTASAVAR